MSILMGYLKIDIVEQGLTIPISILSIVEQALTKFSSSLHETTSKLMY